MNRLANPSDTGRLIWFSDNKTGYRIASVSGDGLTIFGIPVKRDGNSIRRIVGVEPEMFLASEIDWSTMTWPADPPAEFVQEDEEE